MRKLKVYEWINKIIYHFNGFNFRNNNHISINVSSFFSTVLFGSPRREPEIESCPPLKQWRTTFNSPEIAVWMNTFEPG